LEERDFSHIRDILDAYNRANPVNLICTNVLRILLEEDPVKTRAGEPAMLEVSVPWNPRTIPKLPQMLAIQDLDENIRALILELKSPINQSSHVIWPSLYRHLSNWPNYFALGATLLCPRFKSGEIDRSADKLRVAAIQVAREIAEKAPVAGNNKRLVEELKLTLVGTLAAFVRKIPEMIVVGNLLRWSLPGQG
jgi:hypothetical protein